MKFRDSEIVIDAKLGVTVNISEGLDGELIIRAFETYSKNYVNPPIPEGYKYVTGKWSYGFVIERCSDGSQFVWIPVGSLDSNGTLDGKHFTEKFGRRSYRGETFTTDSYQSLYEYSEPLNDEFYEQFESVKKYGGFYISRYAISADSNFWGHIPHSLPKSLPLVNITYEEAKKIATTFENNENVKSHLPFGSEYDSIFEWLLKSNSKTFVEIAIDSSNWGDYKNHFAVYSQDNYNLKTYSNIDCSTTSYEYYDTKTREDSNYGYFSNNIKNLAGDVFEFTQEYVPDSPNQTVLRGGSRISEGYHYPASSRYFCCPSYSKHEYHGFRIALCLK